jgi:hypothetical protein
MKGCRRIAPLATMAPACIDIGSRRQFVEESGVDEDGDSIGYGDLSTTRFTVVRRSSSMMPTLQRARRQAENPRPAKKRSTVNATSSGPCIFGFDYVHRGGT